LAGTDGVIKVHDFGDGVLEAYNSFLKLGEELIKVVEVFLLVVLLVLDSSLAKLADQVRFGSELVDSGRCPGGNSGGNE
jgi:hypothetical protein